MKLLQIDIETAPHVVYAWGLWNQNISINQIVEPGYTLCYAAKWYGKKGVMFDSIHKSGMEDMLKGLIKLLDEADAVIHYNGTKFDMPTLNKEFLLYSTGIPSPYHQIDLLKTARSQFRFPSNKLDYIAQQLGVGKKVEHAGMQLWRDCMMGCSKAWKVMEKYNKQDVLLLEDVYNKLLPWIKDHPNHSLFANSDRPVCTNCGSHHVVKKGIVTTATMKYERFKCTQCGTNLRGRQTVSTAQEKENTLTQVKL